MKNRWMKVGRMGKNNEGKQVKKIKIKMPSGRFTFLLLSPAYAYMPPSLGLRTRLCRPTLFHSLFSALPALPLLLPSLPFPPPRPVDNHFRFLPASLTARTIQFSCESRTPKPKQTKIASSCSRSSSCRFDAVGEFYVFLEFFEKNFWLLLAETE